MKNTLEKKPPFLDEFRLYGSSYIYSNPNIHCLFPLIWMLPHDLRRATFKKFFPKEYWRVLGARQDLEKGFVHSERKNLTYSIEGFHKNRCIFVHIPKCAGISVSQSLFGHCVPHSTITDYQIMFGSEIFKKYFKFTIVRNPWDRFVSAYFFLKNGGFDKTDKKLFSGLTKKFETLEEFTHFIYHNRAYAQWIHFFLPQTKWLKSPSGEIPFDYIGKVEDMDKCLRVICKNIGIDYTPARKENTSQRDRDFRKYYTQETKDMIQELYKEDIDLLGYNFDA